MAEQLAESSHNVWAKKKQLELESKGKARKGRKPFATVCQRATLTHMGITQYTDVL